MQAQRLSRTTAAVLAAAALAAPTAQAKPDLEGTFPEPASSVEAAPAPMRVAGPTVVVESDEASGFDWGAGAIGAGVVSGLGLLAAGALAGSRRQADRLQVRS